MAYSFDGITFSPAISDSVQRVNWLSTQTKRKIPWGDIEVVHFGGMQAGTFAGKIRLTPTNAALLVTRSRTPEVPGTLIVDGTTYINALISKLDGHIITPRREYHFFEVEFYVP